MGHGYTQHLHITQVPVMPHRIHTLHLCLAEHRPNASWMTVMPGASRPCFCFHTV